MPLGLQHPQSLGSQHGFGVQHDGGRHPHGSSVGQQDLQLEFRQGIFDFYNVAIENFYFMVRLFEWTYGVSNAVILASREVIVVLSSWIALIIGATSA